MTSINVRVATARHALVIDDDKFMQVVLSDMLKDLGVPQVATAASGSAGMAAIDRATRAPDVVLCDLNMPGGDGFEFMEALSGKGFNGGIVLVSGQDDRTLNSASLMAKFHSLNILATLKKPVDEAALRAALARLS